MKLLRVAALLFALVNAALVAGQSVQPPPDPVQLDADWWSFFRIDPENAGEALDARILRASQRLQAISTQVPAKTASELAPLIETVDAKLKRYGEFIATDLPAEPPAIAAQASYSLGELRKLVEELRKVSVERISEAQDIAALDRAVSSAERDQSQRKVAYLSLDDAAPQRLKRGLELMQSRLQLELGKRELEFRAARLAALESELGNLQTLVKAAAQRLTAQDATLKDVVAQRERTLQRASVLRTRLAKLELAQSSALALAPVEQARAQVQAQRAFTVEAEALSEEISAAQLGTAEVLLLRASSENALDPVPHRKQLRAFREQIDAAQNRLQQIRAGTLRSRSVALTRVATEEDQQIAAFLRELIDAADDTERQMAALDEQLNVADQFGVLLADQLVGAEGKVGFTIQLLKDWSAEGWTTVTELASASIFEISETPVTALGILRMILIMTIAAWVSKLARRGLLSVASRRESVNTGSIYTLSRMLHYTILAIGIMVALSSIGIDFTKFALFASALGVGIGFGLQTLVSNFVAGLIILFEKSLKVGDFVELESGVTGEVKEINMRSTLVTTNDNIDIVVPNSEFVNSRVTNWTMREAYRRIHIPFGVAYGTDKNLVAKAALEAATEVDVTLTGHKRREPQVWFVEFGDSSLNFELVVWLTPDAVKRPGAVQAAYLWAIDDKLRKYAIEVPFPQRDLHLRSAFGIRDEDGQVLLRGRGPAEGGN